MGSHPLHRAALAAQLRAQRPDHPHRGGLILLRVPPRGRLARRLLLRHDSILVSKARSLHRRQGGSDFTYVPTWSWIVYVAFVIDAYSRRILGWRAATSMKTALVLDASEQAIWARQQAGIIEFDGLVHHNDAGSQG